MGRYYAKMELPHSRFNFIPRHSFATECLKKCRGRLLVLLKGRSDVMLIQTIAHPASVGNRGVSQRLARSLLRVSAAAQLFFIEHAPGNEHVVELFLMYHPGVNYDTLQPGVTFRIMEGPLLVGVGEVIES